MVSLLLHRRFLPLALLAAVASACLDDAQATANARGPLTSENSGGLSARVHQEIPRTAPDQGLAQARETAVVRAAERVSPSVVTVNVIRTQQIRVRDPFDDFFGGFFGPQRGRTQARRVPSLGSGFVVDDQGTILTNDHVVRGAERILVTLPDGRDVEARLIGTDESTDVAVLVVDLPDLPVAPLGTTTDLMIGSG